ncbi:MAG: biotin/lipoate A/B protein ligase family protein [Candidatus Methanomethylophilaceae archaeon]|jgi:lipoate-protein ligase A
MRLIDSGACGPQETLWREDAILEARSRDLIPDTLHVYRRDRPTISMGRFSRREDCLDEEEVRRHGVQVIRRSSGGSCIYTDEDQLIYSVTMDRGSLPETRKEIFPLLCSGIVQALQLLGVEAEYKPINDVLVGGRKISGSAQIRRRGALLQHGTLIMRLDRDRTDSVLRPVKPRSYDGLTSLQEHGVNVGWDKVVEALRQGFQDVLDQTIVPGTFTAWEEDYVNERRSVNDAPCCPR